MIDGSLRVINGFIEHNYQRVAQLLPQADEREIREKIFDCEQHLEPNEYDLGFADGVEQGEEFLYRNLERCLKKLAKGNFISSALVDEILEEML